MGHPLEPLINPRSVVFIGGSSMLASLKYQTELGFAGNTWVVNPKYDSLGGFKCVPSVGDLPEAPDLAFVAIRRELAVAAIGALRERGCRAVVCHAAGFAEIGDAGADLQAQLIEAAGDMPMLGPNAVGLANFVDPMAAIMQHYGLRDPEEHGVAIVSQGGQLLLDVLFSDRGLPVTHVVGGGNQAVTGIEQCVDYLLDDPRVTAIGLSFEAIRDVNALRSVATKALRLEKPIVAIKFGVSVAGARAVASHTASMAGDSARWEALLDRLGIISTRSESEFIETLKLADSGQLPRGRRVLVAAASGVHSVMLADHLSGAGFDLPQPTGERAARLRELLPVLATPGNPQDITAAAWNDDEIQTDIYSALLDEGFDLAMMVQNHPRPGMEHTEEYAAQVDALATACEGRSIAAIELSPLIECFPEQDRAYARSRGLVPLQGLEESVKALSHGVWWQERRETLIEQGLDLLTSEFPAVLGEAAYVDEAAAKAYLSTAGVPVPRSHVCAPAEAAAAAREIGFPVVLKAVDARLLHKTEVGAIRVNLRSPDEVQAAVAAISADMSRLAPDIALEKVLVEAMATDVVAEFMVSVSHDATLGPMMLVAGGGGEAELWDDSVVIAAPFTRVEIERAVDRLKVAARLGGWRGRPAGDREALLGMLESLRDYALGSAVEEVEINPVLVGTAGALAVDAVLRVSPAEKHLNLS